MNGGISDNAQMLYHVFCGIPCGSAFGTLSSAAPARINVMNSYYDIFPSFISIFRHRFNVNSGLSFSNNPRDMNLYIFMVIVSLIASILFYATGLLGASAIDRSNSSRTYFNDV